MPIVPIVISFLLCLGLAGCHDYPDTVTPVENFVLDKYMGKWYEVARLDHSFERGLSHVSAVYEVKDDGVVITNRGYSKDNKKWEEAIGHATFYDNNSIGHLKVSFFGPFSSSYLIFELGSNYQHAFVCGPNTSYLWLLSRKKNGNEALVERFIQVAAEKGFSTKDLIIVDHESMH